MQKSIAKELPRGRMARRVAAAGMAVAAAVGLAGCHEARGGGYLGAPVDSGVIGVYSGTANFGFNFTCDADQIKGEITYHDDPSKITLVGTTLPLQFPEIRVHGDVDKVLVEVPDSDNPDTDIFDPVFKAADTCQEVV